MFRVILISNISTRVRLGLVIDDNIILTISTAEEFVYLVGAIDCHTRCGSTSSITTAIDGLDAGTLTTVDNHSSSRFRGFYFCSSSCCLSGIRFVSRQVATAIDRRYVIASFHLRRLFALGRIGDACSISVLRLIDMHRCRTLRRTVQVVASKDTTLHDAALLAVIHGIRTCLRIVNQSKRAIFIFGIVCSVHTVQVYRGSAHRCRNTLCCHLVIAIPYLLSAFTATIDITVDSATKKDYLCIASHIGHITTAVDIVFDATFKQIHHSIAVHLTGITATINITVNDAVIINGHRCIAAYSTKIF